MRTIFNKVLCALTLCLAAVFSLSLTSCGDDALSKEIEELNENLPMNIGNGMSWASVSLEDDVMSFNFTIDETMLPGAIEEFNANKAEMSLAMIQQLRTSLSSSEGGKEVRKEIKEKGIKVKVVFEGTESGQQCVVNIPSGAL
ncbi:MAG: hypothetical protein MR679_00355 [Bacteroidales bacterium]|nr:hypothetical protein [Bacteroidales bacterium]